MAGHKKKPIRNSTVEFLIFTGQASDQSIEARYEDGNVGHLTARRIHRTTA